MTKEQGEIFNRFQNYLRDNQFNIQNGIFKTTKEIDKKGDSQENITDSYTKFHERVRNIYENSIGYYTNIEDIFNKPEIMALFKDIHKNNKVMDESFITKLNKVSDIIFNELNESRDVVDPEAKIELRKILKDEIDFNLLQNEIESDPGFVYGINNGSDNSFIENEGLYDLDYAFDEFYSFLNEKKSKELPNLTDDQLNKAKFNLVAESSLQTVMGDYLTKPLDPSNPLYYSVLYNEYKDEFIEHMNEKEPDFKIPLTINEIQNAFHQRELENAVLQYNSILIKNQYDPTTGVVVSDVVSTRKYLEDPGTTKKLLEEKDIDYNSMNPKDLNNMAKILNYAKGVEIMVSKFPDHMTNLDEINKTEIGGVKIGNKINKLPTNFALDAQRNIAYLRIIGNELKETDKVFNEMISNIEKVPSFIKATDKKGKSKEEIMEMEEDAKKHKLNEVEAKRLNGILINHLNSLSDTSISKEKKEKLLFMLSNNSFESDLDSFYKELEDIKAENTVKSSYIDDVNNSIDKHLTNKSITGKKLELNNNLETLSQTNNFDHKSAKYKLKEDLKKEMAQWEKNGKGFLAFVHQMTAPNVSLEKIGISDFIFMGFAAKAIFAALVSSLSLFALCTKLAIENSQNAKTLSNLVKLEKDMVDFTNSSSDNKEELSIIIKKVISDDNIDVISDLKKEEILNLINDKQGFKQAKYSIDGLSIDENNEINYEGKTLGIKLTPEDISITKISDAMVSLDKSSELGFKSYNDLVKHLSQFSKDNNGLSETLGKTHTKDTLITILSLAHMNITSAKDRLFLARGINEKDIRQIENKIANNSIDTNSDEYKNYIMLRKSLKLEDTDDFIQVLTKKSTMDRNNLFELVYNLKDDPNKLVLSELVLMLKEQKLENEFLEFLDNHHDEAIDKLKFISDVNKTLNNYGNPMSEEKLNKHKFHEIDMKSIVLFENNITNNIPNSSELKLKIEKDLTESLDSIKNASKHYNFVNSIKNNVDMEKYNINSIDNNNKIIEKLIIGGMTYKEISELNLKIKEDISAKQKITELDTKLNKTVDTISNNIKLQINQGLKIEDIEEFNKNIEIVKKTNSYIQGTEKIQTDINALNPRTGLRGYINGLNMEQLKEKHIKSLEHINEMSSGKESTKALMKITIVGNILHNLLENNNSVNPLDIEKINKKMNEQVSDLETSLGEDFTEAKEKAFKDKEIQVKLKELQAEIDIKLEEKKALEANDSGQSIKNHNGLYFN